LSQDNEGKNQEMAELKRQNEELESQIKDAEAKYL
jgi:cell division protein FtsB